MTSPIAAAATGWIDRRLKDCAARSVRHAAAVRAALPEILVEPVGMLEKRIEYYAGVGHEC